MQQLLSDLQKFLGLGRVKEQEPMDIHTAFRAGGTASIYVEVDKLLDLIEIVKRARTAQIPVRILGSGTNLLVADEGFPGVFIKNNCRGFEVMSMRGKILKQQIGVNNVLLYCESGAILNQVVRYTLDEGLSGLEYQLGLPGTIGGGVYMNSQYPQKAQFVGDSLQSAQILTPEGEIREVDRDYFNFAFDYSRLQDTGDILLSATFSLNPSDKHLLWERGQKAANDRINEQPRAMGTGVTYRNMEVTKVDRSSNFLGKPNVEEILIESGSLDKSSGDVKLYEKRYNYVLNMREAKIADVDTLAENIKKQTKEKTGVNLHFNTHIIGK